jgi:hypothetical protein
MHTDEKNRKVTEIMFQEIRVQDQFGDRARDGGKFQKFIFGKWVPKVSA